MSSIVFGESFERKYLEDTYDHVEDYDSTKQYAKGEFEADYGHGKRLYTWGLIQSFTSNTPLFAYAKRQYTEEYLKKIESYCGCKGCTTPKFTLSYLFKFLVHSNCGCCNGCVKSGPFFASESLIKEAENKYNKELE